jgi:GTPase SAR1 family protein
MRITMNTQTNTFNLADLNENFTRIIDEILKDLNQAGTQYQGYVQNIEKNITDMHEQKLIKVALVGQYSSGKSTIISALTNNRQIKIDADIATAESTDYEWNNILLTDTPGISTDRKEHDEITKDTIRKSDLIVYVITSSLFDNIILNDFIDLAYKANYKNKIILVVNKMSMETGEFETLVINYTESLRKSFSSYGFELKKDFRLVFIDANDYLEGKDTNEPELIQLSMFDTFISELNSFVNEKGLLGKMDTPIRFSISEVDSAINESNEKIDKEFFSVLSRIERKVIRNREKTESEINTIIGKLTNRIIIKGEEAGDLLGMKEDEFKSEINKINVELEKDVNTASKSINEFLTKKVHELNNEIKDIFNSDAVEWISKFDVNANLNTGFAANLNNSINQNVIDYQKKLGKLKEFIGFGSDISAKVAQVGTYTIRGTVKDVGHLFGVKFWPWQAHGIAKNIGAFAEIAGKAFSVLVIILEAKGIYDEHKREQSLQVEKNKIRGEFENISTDVSRDFRKEYDTFCVDAYESILKQILELRNESTKKKENLSEIQKKLISHKDKLVSLLDLIHK